MDAALISRDIIPTTNLVVIEVPRPEIPTEVVERIIDKVAELVDGFYGQNLERTHSLHACSLVGRKWVHRSRPHLFRDVRLSSDWSTRRFLDSLAQCRALGQYLETLRVWPSNEDEMSCGWMFKALSTLPPLVPHLRELVFGQLPDLRPQCFAVLFRFSTVESLVLYDLGRQSLREVVLLISRFPQLRRLQVRDCRWGLPGRCYSGKQHSLTTLQVNNGGDWDRSFLEWALASKSTHALTTFRARSDVAGSAMHRVLETCCSTLRELHLRLCGDDGEWLWMLFFRMLTCSLRSALAHKSSQFATSRFGGIPR